MGIKAVFPAGVTEITVHGLHQWDRGQTLEIHDSTLPSVIEVHFANCDAREAVVHSAPVTNGVATVSIPNECLIKTTPMMVWIYEIARTSGRTVRTIRVPLTPRAKPANISVEDDGLHVEMGLPEVTEADNGKFMRVVSGVWAAASLRNAEEVNV